MAPSDWDPRRERTKAKPCTYLDDINTILDRYADAATAAEHEAQQLSCVPDKPAMKAEIERRYAELTAEAAGLLAVSPPLPPAPPTFSQYYDRWLGKQSRSENLRTGHTTERSINRYVGIDEDELVENYRKTARKAPREQAGKTAA